MPNENLLEYVAVGKIGHVDRESGRISGVRVLGAKSKNNRFYPEATIRAAAPLYSGCRVHVDHPDHAGKVRSYATQIGRLENVTIDAGLRADLAINLGHSLSDQLLWDSQNCPENLGLSHNIHARTARRGDGVVEVTEICKVISVDIVCDPATSTSLFEHEDREGAAKVALVESVARSLGLIPSTVQDLAGLRSRESEAEIHAYLEQIREFLIEKGVMTAEPLLATHPLDRIPAGADGKAFIRAISGRSSKADHDRFAEIMNLPTNRNGDLAGFVDSIT